MAISANTVFECRASGAADTAGGGFVGGSGGTDRSQQAAAQVAVGGGVVTSSVATTVITFTGGTYTVLAGDVGNIVQVISGTNTTPGFFEITSVGAGLNGTWTMDRNVVSAGTQTDLVANMGGALLTLAKLSGAMVASNKAFITGSFSSTATTTFAQSVANPVAATPHTRLIGYGAARGDATAATLTLSTNTGLTGINATGAGFGISQVTVDCASLGTSTGIALTGNFSYAEKCKVSNYKTNGIACTANFNLVVYCEVTGGTGTAILFAVNKDEGLVFNCWVHDNAGTGINLLNVAHALSNLIANNTGATSNGISGAGGNFVLGNTVHASGQHGFQLTAATNSVPSIIKNNLFSNNGGFGCVASVGTAFAARYLWDGNAYYSNTSGTRSLMDSVTGIFGVNPYVNVLDVTLTASPYVGPTSGGSENFKLNNTAGGGAACKAAGIPGTFPGLSTTTGYLDMGAAQHQDAGGSHFIGGN